MLRLSPLAALCLAIAVSLAVPPRGAAAAGSAATYYVSLGDSLAASFQPNGDLTHGYAEQLHAALAHDDTKLRLVKLGCFGESTASMRYGTQAPTEVLSCATPRGYKDLYPRGTQLAEALGFLEAHKGKVALVTITIGGNDLQHFDTHGNVVICLVEPAGCDSRTNALARNLTAILDQLKGAAGPGVPIVGMTYDDVFAPSCVTDPSTAFACSRFNTFDGVLADTYAAAGIPVADVAGVFENDDLTSASAHVCAWTWFCSIGDIHPNTAGYGAIAGAFEQALAARNAAVRRQAAPRAWMREG